MEASTVLHELDYHDACHDSDIKVEIIASTLLSMQLRVRDCDQGVLEALVANLRTRKRHVEFVSTNWLHPLKRESEILIRRTAGAVDEGIELQTLIMSSINDFTNSVWAHEPVFYQRWSEEMDWVMISGDTVALCEGPGGRRLHVKALVEAKPRSMCNVYRRFLLSSVATLAIESLTIRENTSMLPDQVLAHRFGMLPIRYRHGQTPPAHFDNACFRVQVSVPKDNNQTIVKVESTDVVTLLSDVQLAFTGDGQAFALAVLSPGQAVEAIAQVSVGCGGQHVKHVAVGQVAIHQMDKALDPEISQKYGISYYLCGQLSGPICFKNATRSIVHTLVGLRQACSIACHQFETSSQNKA